MFSGLPRKRISPVLELLLPSALRERGHRRLACRLVAVGWRAVLMVAKAKRPHPRRTLRRGVHLHDAADDGAFDEHVEVVIVPLAEERKADACLRMMALRIALGVFQPSPPWVS